MNFKELMQTYGIYDAQSLAERINYHVELVIGTFDGRIPYSVTEFSQKKHVKAISAALECPIDTLFDAYFETRCSGYVYVMQTTDIQKIGRSKDPAARHRTLNFEYPSLILVHQIFTNYADSLERHIHQHFLRYRLVASGFVCHKMN